MRTEKDHDLYREEARELMKQIQERCLEYDPDRKVGEFDTFSLSLSNSLLSLVIHHC